MICYYMDEHLAVVFKPAGYHVHQPELPRRRVPRELTVLFLARKYFGRKIYPVHRIDVATEGLLLIAFSSSVAGTLNRFLREGIQCEKLYYCVVRGFVAESGVIRSPLSLDSTGVLVEAVTEYSRLSQAELPFSVGKRYTTARYSFLQVRPRSGRWHQIRRHFRDLGHPLIGDREHGDSYHNRFFRESLGLKGLFLRAHGIAISHPVSGERIQIQAHWTPRWLRLIETMRWEVPSDQNSDSTTCAGMILPELETKQNLPQDLQNQP